MNSNRRSFAEKAFKIMDKDKSGILNMTTSKEFTMANFIQM